MNQINEEISFHNPKPQPNHGANDDRLPHKRKKVRKLSNRSHHSPPHTKTVLPSRNPDPQLLQLNEQGPQHLFNKSNTRTHTHTHTRTPSHSHTHAHLQLFELLCANFVPSQFPGYRSPTDKTAKPENLVISVFDSKTFESNFEGSAVCCDCE
jgi:hypothetical protein